MKKYVQILVVIVALCAISNASFSQTVKATISNNSKLIISRQIYGQFAEHLGRGIYDGFWVNKNMPVKKTG